jgi:hypothetical protein
MVALRAEGAAAAVELFFQSTFPPSSLFLSLFERLFHFPLRLLLSVSVVGCCETVTAIIALLR